MNGNSLKVVSSYPDNPPADFNHWQGHLYLQRQLHWKGRISFTDLRTYHRIARPRMHKILTQNNNYGK